MRAGNRRLLRARRLCPLYGRGTAQRWLLRSRRPQRQYGSWQHPQSHVHWLQDYALSNTVKVFFSARSVDANVRFDDGYNFQTGLVADGNPAAQQLTAPRAGRTGAEIKLFDGAFVNIFAIQGVGRRAGLKQRFLTRPQADAIIDRKQRVEQAAKKLRLPLAPTGRCPCRHRQK